MLLVVNIIEFGLMKDKDEFYFAIWSDTCERLHCENLEEEDNSYDINFYYDK